MPITIHQLAVHRGLKTQPDGSYSAADIAETRLQLIGGCQGCHATIASYNAHPSKSGYWLCSDCVSDESGYATVEEANFTIFGEGDAPQFTEKSDTTTILVALRLFQREYEGVDAKTIQADWPDHFELVTPPFDDPELCVSPQPLSTADIDTLCEKINFGEWPEKPKPASLRQTLVSHFPWLENGHEDVSGSDVISQLQDMYDTSL